MLDVADSPLHVLGYSLPVDAVLPLDELRAMSSRTRRIPELVPYRTSYWEEQWGFCMSRRRLESLEEGDYRVVIDASLTDGSLTSGEVTIPGASDDEFLLSTYVCHPALANDNLSGIVLLWALARTLAGQRLTHTYRLLWSPGTLGPLCWLSATSRRSTAYAMASWSRASAIPGRSGTSGAGAGTPRSTVPPPTCGREPESIVGDWQPSGGDERQYCSPGFDLPVGTLSRTPHGLFPEYHSSADDLSLVTPEALCIVVPDSARDHRSRRDERSVPQPLALRRAAARQAGPLPERPRRDKPEAAFLWLLNLSDGENDLLAIAERRGFPSKPSGRGATLEQHDLLEEIA